jgi:hypothetical protein
MMRENGLRKEIRSKIMSLITQIHQVAHGGLTSNVLFFHEPQSIV